MKRNLMWLIVTSVVCLLATPTHAHYYYTMTGSYDTGEELTEYTIGHLEVSSCMVGGLLKLDVRLHDWNGTFQNMLIANGFGDLSGARLLGLSGTWSTNDPRNGICVLTDPPSGHYLDVMKLQGQTPPAAPESFVNFGSAMYYGETRTLSTNTSAPPGYSLYSSIYGDWYPSPRLHPGDPIGIGVGELIATMFVKQNTETGLCVQFNAAAGNYICIDDDGGIGVAGFSPASFSIVMTIPEPSTLMLLGCGLFGLLAHAWRKRR